MVVIVNNNLQELHVSSKISMISFLLESFEAKNYFDVFMFLRKVMP